MMNNKTEVVAILEYILQYSDYIGFSEDQRMKIEAIKDCMQNNPNAIKNAMRGGNLVFDIVKKPTKSISCYVIPRVVDEYMLQLSELKREEEAIEERKDVLSKKLTDENITEINALNIRLYNIERNRMDLIKRINHNKKKGRVDI